MKCIDENAASVEFCPVCRTSTTMSVSAAPDSVFTSKGKIKIIVFKTFHCESCRSFVRSILRPESKPKSKASRAKTQRKSLKGRGFKSKNSLSFSLRLGDFARKLALSLLRNLAQIVPLSGIRFSMRRNTISPIKAFGDGGFTMARFFWLFSKKSALAIRGS
jgi:hypothetical protein